MATKSILKTVHIKEPEAARKLVDALENAEKKQVKSNSAARRVSAASREEIREMFRNDANN